MLGKEVKKRYLALKTQREPLEPIWADAFRYTVPNRGMAFENSESNGYDNARSARDLLADLFDSTAGDSCRLLAASMLAGLTPPNSQWFNLGVPIIGDDVPYDVKLFLEQASNILYQMIHSSNYDSEAIEFFFDVVICGMGGLYIELNEDYEFQFEYWPLSDMYCVETLNRKVIDTVYRRLQYTADQAINKFGAKNLPDYINDENRDKPESQKKYDFVHCIMPRVKNGKQAVGNSNKTMPYMSMYIDLKDATVVKESGYIEFPVVIPRWQQLPKTVYAVGPLDLAMPDVKSVNKHIEKIHTNADLLIRPPVMVKQGGITDPEELVISSGAAIPVMDMNSIKALELGGDFGFIQADILRMQAQIKKVLMSDQLSPQGNIQMTATEVAVRVKLIRQLLGPIFGRFQAEFLQPMIERTYGLADRAGLLGPAPRELEQFKFNATFFSPLARAQREEEVQAIASFETSIAQTAQIEPNVLDNYNFDKATEVKAVLLGVPINLMRDQVDKDKIRKDRAEAQQAQAELSPQGAVNG